MIGDYVVADTHVQISAHFGPLKSLNYLSEITEPTPLTLNENSVILVEKIRITLEWFLGISYIVSIKISLGIPLQ
ncbi:hypothetical protein Lepto7375DRAFT_1919 [Leptolyngbya sp. PCC 7375]|nr:hypothetical protein Lepto7375DRAFT_1919 [Leptolyngbya sp. PCC 7375]